MKGWIDGRMNEKVFEEGMKKTSWLSKINIAVAINSFNILPYFITPTKTLF